MPLSLSVVLFIASAALLYGDHRSVRKPIRRKSDQNSPRDVESTKLMRNFANHGIRSRSNLIYDHAGNVLGVRVSLVWRRRVCGSSFISKENYSAALHDFELMMIQLPKTDYSKVYLGGRRVFKDEDSEDSEGEKVRQVSSGA